MSNLTSLSYMSNLSNRILLSNLSYLSYFRNLCNLSEIPSNLTNNGITVSEKGREACTLIIPCKLLEHFFLVFKS